MVKAAIREKPNYTIDDYKEDVGKNVSAFANAYVEHLNKREMDWRGWLASQDFGEATEYFGDVTRHQSRNARNRAGDKKWAFAFHYRLHGHFDRFEKYAWAIDELVFGERCRARGQSVFFRPTKKGDFSAQPPSKEEFASQQIASATAPLVQPTYITADQAFTENEHTSAIWLNPHNHHSLPLVGRDKEWKLLEKFIGSEEKFKIAALVAPSGAGKTRLVSQWAKTYIDGEKSGKWDAGFVDIPNANLWNEANWQPSKNTLIIIDYTYNFADVIGTVMKRFESGAQHIIRLLILDHVLPEKLHQDGPVAV